MFNLSKDEKLIIKLAEIDQKLTAELHVKEPDNETFEQEGILNGLSIVKEYIDQDEFALAIEHLLYIIYESDISYPAKEFQEIHNLTSKYEINNFYAT